jgi:hypothetical protein
MNFYRKKQSETGSTDVVIRGGDKNIAPAPIAAQRKIRPATIRLAKI